MLVLADLLPGHDAGAVRAAGATPADGAGWTVVRTPAEIRAAQGANLWIRGLEAGGPTTPFAATTLIRAAVATGRPWVVDGIGPRAMAACLAVGAAGIVVGPELWLTVESPVHADHRAALRGATGARDTEIAQGTRILSRGAGRRGILAAEWWTNPAAPVPAPQSVAGVALGDGRTTADAIRAVVAEVERHRAAILPDLALADPFGTGRPLVQGPMANVSEQPGLAQVVAGVGGVPFLALGALDPEAAAERVAGFAGLKPWGAGVIGFDVMPHRDAHLALLAAARPAYVTLAGGTVELAIQVQRSGAEVWLHTPSGRLARSALDAGVGVILEGHEAGGHVGAVSSLGLWEEGLAAAEERPGTVILAGGIADATTAALAFAMAGSAAAAGSKIGIQVGTAWMFTHEIVEIGQITATYQQAALSADATVLVGATVNLPLRCAPNRFTEDARASEHRWAADGVDRAERRQRIETFNLGRTRVAARGIERDPRPGGSRYRPVPVARQVHEGAYTLGEGATVTDRLCTARELADAVTVGAAAILGGARPQARGPRRVGGAPPATVARRQSAAEAIAVVGFGCVLPGANDVPTFWRNLLHAVDAVDAVPEDRWSRDRYWHPDASPQIGAPTLSYSLLAGAVSGFRFDPVRFRIPPRVIPTLDRSQQLALVASEEAIRSAGWSTGIDRSRAAVVFGNAMGGEHAKSLAVRVRFREVMAVLAEDPATHGWTATDLQALEARVEHRLAGKLPPIDVESMAGLLSNVVAGRIASWLDWMGGNLTVDAACAASLAAIGVAVDWLRTGRCDAVLAGGVDTDLAPETFVGFCRTDALSAQGSAPFSSRADGFVMGEGCAAFALKRLSDARRDGDPIWAVIRGVGQASDGRGKGITAPRAEGQKLAIERAHAEAGIGAGTIGMVEAHGTGTPLGDATELAVLQDWHAASAKSPPWLGSVKAQIGHLKGAAGAAGLLKACLAVATGTIPPTLHGGPVTPALATGLRLPRTPVGFPARHGPRRASVSAFGFGGTNYHLLVEQAPDGGSTLPEWASKEASRVHTDLEEAWDDRPPSVLACYAGTTRAELAVAVAQDAPTSPERAAAAPCRLAVVHPAGARQSALDRVGPWLAQAELEPLRIEGGAAFYGEGPPRPVVALVPGQGSQRAGAWTRAARWPAGARALRGLDEARGWETEADGAARSDPEALHRSLFAVAAAWAAVVGAAGIPLAATLGHSLGELGALVAGGRLEPGAGLRLAIARGKALAACPPGGMLAVELPEAEAIALDPELAVAAVNGPRSTVLAGPAIAVARVAGAVAGSRILAVDRAFHSPSVAPAAAAVRALRVAFAPGATVWSAATATPMPADVLAALAEAVVVPVRFADAIAGIAAAFPAPVWLELGPGSMLARRARSLAGGVAAPLDPDDGLPLAAAALVAAGHPGLARIAPRTWLELAPGIPARVERATPRLLGDRPLGEIRALTVSVEPAHRSAEVATDPELAARAEAVQDLRIASLADPTLVPAWRDARAALLAALADADRVRAGSAAPRPPAAGEAPPPVVVLPVEPPRPAHAPVVPAPAAPAPPAAPNALRDAVLAAITEVTGYPADVLTDDADLEADLGIDSIRKMEVLGQLQKRLGFTSSEADYAELARVDLAGLVRYVGRRAGEAPAATATVTHDAPLLALPMHAPIADAAPSPDAAPLPAPGEHADGVWIAPDAEPEAVVGAWLAWARDRRPVPLTVAHHGTPGGEAAVGFGRSLAREWGVPIRVIRYAADTPHARLHAEIHAPERPETVVLGPTSTAAVEWVATAGGAALLPERPVCLVSGGAGGIVARCLLGLADLRPRALILGRRTPAPADLARLTDAGIDVAFRQTDLEDAGQVAAAAADARRRWGRIDVVLHGAGQLRDGRVTALADDAIAAVLGPKLTGARNLFAATEADRPRLWVGFGSLVAIAGNPGQTLYGAANAALAALVHPTAERSLTLALTAWDEVGMAAKPGMAAALAARGIPVMSPAAGARAFRAALGLDGPVVLVGAPPAMLRPAAWPLGAPARWDRAGVVAPIPLDPADPALADHHVAGRPLVPAAVWLVAIHRAALLAAPGRWSVNSFRVHVPTFVDQPRGDVEVRVLRDRDGWTAAIHAGSTVVADATLRPASAPDRSSPPSPLHGDAAGALYRPDGLFHGPTWQVLREISSNGNGLARADLALGTVDPLAGVVDAAYQVAAAWSARSTGWLALPTGAARWTLAANATSVVTVRLEVDVHAVEGGVTADVRALDPSGCEIARGEGLALKAAGRAPSDLFWPEPTE